MEKGALFSCLFDHLVNRQENHVRKQARTVHAPTGMNFLVTCSSVLNIWRLFDSLEQGL